MLDVNLNVAEGRIESLMVGGKGKLIETRRISLDTANCRKKTYRGVVFRILKRDILI